MKIKDLDKINILYNLYKVKILYNLYKVKKTEYENLKAIEDKECFALVSKSIDQTTSFELTDYEVNIILKRLSLELEEIIKELENLGVKI